MIWRRNADRRLAEGVKIFLAGGAHELPGEVLARVRDAADAALLEDRHIPVSGGPVAPEGWIWVELENAFRELGHMSGAMVLERLLAGNERFEYVLGDAEEWGLEGKARDWHVEVDNDPMSMHGPGVYYQAWLLVPRGPNWDRVGGRE